MVDVGCCMSPIVQDDQNGKKENNFVYCGCVSCSICP